MKNLPKNANSCYIICNFILPFPSCSLFGGGQVSNTADEAANIST
ncbi:hypothetical protein HMPREF1870_01279 [Bacteroidales bacterium KA00344]|nr:hypothetical protein HMPREF1870_01279 [Bacteroidales bacterium KA00344]